MKVKVTQSCLTLCNPFGILQARLLEWVAFPTSRGSSQPRDQTQVPLIAGGSYGNSVNFGGNYHKVFCSSCTVFTFSQCTSVQISSHTGQHVLFFLLKFFNGNRSNGCEVVPHCSFDLHFHTYQLHWASFQKLIDH